jgi:hypothetical protein
MRPGLLHRENGIHTSMGIVMQRAAVKRQLQALGATQQVMAAGIVKRLRSLGPYIVLELLLPGGTLFSLLLFLYRRGGAGLADASSEGGVRPVLVVARIAAGVKSFWC